MKDVRNTVVHEYIEDDLVEHRLWVFRNITIIY